MKGAFKIALNAFLFLLIAGFGAYMIFSVAGSNDASFGDGENEESTLISPYTKVLSWDTESHIECFDIFENVLYAVQSNQISLFDLTGKHLFNFEIESNVRDMAIHQEAMYLLYPTRIDVYSFDGQKIHDWEACSNLSDYCSITATANSIYVTDAANKHICQYHRDGEFVRFISSPQGFVIPSYSFDIIAINDTLYCSNSGRHTVESYTLDGNFISSFGVAGAQPGAFAGCCNPVYLSKNMDNNILTSEKGNPRISCYGKNGQFRAILLYSKALGGGTQAVHVHTWEGSIYISNKNTISVFRLNPSTVQQSCIGCASKCYL